MDHPVTLCCEGSSDDHTIVGNQALHLGGQHLTGNPRIRPPHSTRVDEHTAPVSAKAEGDGVSLPVADTACGISPDNVAKRFDPPFTTKAGGIAKNLVKANGSRIEVESEEGLGSTFRVRLPWQKRRGKMSERGWYVRLLVIVATIVLAACQQASPPFECTDAIGCVTIAPGEPLKLGVIQAVSGGVAPIGVDQTRGIELALAARDNQVLGHPIEVQIEDERCSSEGGTIAAMKIVAAPQIVAVVGTTCSGAAVTAAKIVSEAGLAMVSGANTAPCLTAIGGIQGHDWQPGYLRTTQNEAVVAQAAATFVLQELGVTQAAAVHDGDSYTHGYVEVFEQAFTDMGGEVVLVAAVDKGDTDMHPVLAAVAASGAEIVFFPLFQPEADLIVLQAKEVAGLESIILMGGGALLADSFIESVGADGVGMYLVGQAPLQSPALDELVSAYEARYDESPGTSGLGLAYDAANLLLNGIEAVAVQDVGAVGTLHIGRQALREALYATTDFEGVSGTFICDKFGDCNTASFHVMRLADVNSRRA